MLWQESTSSLSGDLLGGRFGHEGIADVSSRKPNIRGADPISVGHDFVHSVVPRGLRLESRAFRTAHSVIAAKFSPVTVRPQWLRVSTWPKPPAVG